MALASLASPLTSLANTTLGVINGGQRVVCSEFYGAFPYSFDCKDAIRKMPSGDAAIPYTINSGYVPSKRLPQYSKAADCMVQVEMAGPRQPPTVTLVPNDIKAMATRVLETCTKKTSYIGGFLTSDLGGMKQWLTSSEGDLDRPMPYSTSFLTVSLSTPHSEYFSPGDYDPCMAYIFAQFEFQAAALLPSTSWMAETLRHRGERLLRAINMMQPRGRRIPWWGDPGRPLTVLEQPGGEGNTTVEEQ